MTEHQPVTIVMVEDDEGHARLIEKNIRRAGIHNDIRHFMDGTSALEYLFKADDGKIMMDESGAAQAPNADLAAERARQMVATPGCVSASIFEIAYDPTTGSFAEPVLLQRFGQPYRVAFDVERSA